MPAAVTARAADWRSRGGAKIARRDAWGQFCFVRDLRSGAVWSTTYQPTLVEPDDYEVAFGPDRAIVRRRDGTIDVHTEIAVSPEDDVELRRVSVINRGTAVREIELTSYAEVVLAPEGGDLAHPAFGNLFVETTLLPDRDAILCTRRPRGDEPRRYLVHVLASRGRVGGGAEFETDRARFLGRLGQVAMPQALRSRQPLSGTSGAVLDPIVSVRQRVRLPPGATARLSFVTGYAESEEQARALIEKYHDRQAVARALALAGGHSHAELRHLNLDDRQANAIQRLASRLRFADPRLRQADAIARNRQSRDALWTPWHLRRPADPAGRHRPGRRSRRGARGPQGARVLPAEGLRLRSGAPQRVRQRLSPGGAGPDRRAHRGQSVGKLARHSPPACS